MKSCSTLLFYFLFCSSNISTISSSRVADGSVAQWIAYAPETRSASGDNTSDLWQSCNFIINAHKMLHLSSTTSCMLPHAVGGEGGGAIFPLSVLSCKKYCPGNSRKTLIGSAAVAVRHCYLIESFAGDVLSKQEKDRNSIASKTMRKTQLGKQALLISIHYVQYACRNKWG